MDVTKLLQIDLKEMMTNCCCIACEAAEIEKAYFSTDATSTVSGLSNDTDAATLNSKLTKAEFINGITFAQELFDMFNNEAVTQGDYQATCNKLKYGSAAIPEKLTEATEAIGDRLKTLAENAFTIYQYSKKVLQVYSAEEVGDMIADLDDYRRIPGSTVNKQQLNSAVTYCAQFVNFMTNQAVTQGDYATIVASWQSV